MANWEPYREPLRTTVKRTFLIAAIAAAILAPWMGGFHTWPLLALLLLWPAFGGHWVDVLFLNWLRPRLPSAPAVQRIARILVWFAGGVLLSIGARWTAAMFTPGRLEVWLWWAIAGTLFVVIELVAHAALQMRGRPSFYNGAG